MSLFDGPFVAALGLALVHFLWQGFVIAALLELVLTGLREGSSAARYVVRCVALAAMALAPIVTFALVYPTAAPIDPALASALEPGAGASWPFLVVSGWSLGASCLSVRLVRDYLRVRGLQRSPGDPLPIEWQGRFDRLAEALGVRAVARVVDSAVLATPTVIGWFKPVVLMPARVLTGLTPAQIDALIAHELAHVRRHDFAVNLVQSAIEVLLFYHPAVWFVSRGIRNEREFCCDDVALHLTTDPFAYARALTTLEGWRSAEPEIAMSTVGGSLMQRIQRLIGRRPSPGARGPLSAIAILVVTGLLGATAFAGSTPEEESERIAALQQRIRQLQERIEELQTLTDRVAADAAAERADRDHARSIERRHRHEDERAEAERARRRARALDADALAERVAEAVERARRVDVEEALRKAELANRLAHGLDADAIRAQVTDALRHVEHLNIGKELDEDVKGRIAEALEHAERKRWNLPKPKDAAGLETRRALDLGDVDADRIRIRIAEGLEHAKIGARRAAELAGDVELHEHVKRALEDARAIEIDGEELRRHVHELLQEHVHPHVERIDADRVRQHVHELLQEHALPHVERIDADRIQDHVHELLQRIEDGDVHLPGEHANEVIRRRPEHKHDGDVLRLKLRIEEDNELGRRTDERREHVHRILKEKVLPHVRHLDRATLERLKESLHDVSLTDDAKVELKELHEHLLRSLPADDGLKATRAHLEELHEHLLRAGNAEVTEVDLPELHEHLMRALHERGNRDSKIDLQRLHEHLLRSLHPGHDDAEETTAEDAGSTRAI